MVFLCPRAVGYRNHSKGGFDAPKGSMHFQWMSVRTSIGIASTSHLRPFCSITRIPYLPFDVSSARVTKEGLCVRRLRDPTHGTGIDFYTNLWGWLTWSPCKIMQAYTIGMCAYIYIYICMGGC